MLTPKRHFVHGFRRMTGSLVRSPWLPAIFPLLAFSGYLVGGEVVLAVLALGLPLVWLAVMALRPLPAAMPGADPVTRLATKGQFNDFCAHVLADCDRTGQDMLCMMIELDDPGYLSERFGTGACDQIAETLAHRLKAAARGSDRFARLADWRLGFLAASGARLDLEAGIQIAARLQSILEEPIRVHNAPVYLSFSIGFCLLRTCPDPDAETILRATELALDDARRNGPAGIRAYAPSMALSAPLAHQMSTEAPRALDAGEIRAWFQPQISAADNRISGFEALARWNHPLKGLIPPGDFLPALEAHHALERLGEVILHDAMTLLRDTDNLGIHIPLVSVNVTQNELANPKLVERIQWECDRFLISPDRVGVEILEHVVASGDDDMIARNIAALSEAGCRIDLDDFGTGHASITSLKRFAIDRLKIDRSFVVQCDINTDQRNMVATILTMARQLDLETLAEGVETVGERATLHELGCDYLQGFGIARPMPAESVPGWIADHNNRHTADHAPIPRPATQGLRRE